MARAVSNISYRKSADDESLFIEAGSKVNKKDFKQEDYKALVESGAVTEDDSSISDAPDPTSIGNISASPTSAGLETPSPEE